MPTPQRIVRRLVSTLAVAVTATGTLALAAYGAPPAPAGTGLEKAGAARHLTAVATANPMAAPRARQRSGTLVAVGDVACAPGQQPTKTTCRQADTADLTERLRPEAIIGLGDLQYETGALGDYLGSYDKSWGKLLGRTWPVAGNHEYRTPRSAGFNAYFDGSPGVDAAPDRPYVRDIGGWRVYLLDSNCEVIDCGDEADWLTDDLRRNPRRCTMIAQHHSRWSTGEHGDNGTVDAIWQAATRNGVDVALAAHDHDYERFAPRGPDGRVTRSGTRSFVVGTGGKSFYPFGASSSATRFRQNTSFGVLHLKLTPRRYTWRYVATSGRVLDRGRQACR